MLALEKKLKDSKEKKEKKVKEKNEDDYKSFLCAINAAPNDMIIRTIENVEIKSWLRMEHVNIVFD